MVCLHKSKYAIFILLVQIISIFCIRIPLSGLRTVPLTTKTIKQTDNNPTSVKVVESITNSASRRRSRFLYVDSIFYYLFRNRSKKKILILMSDTGGGHRASAEAIQQAIHEQYPRKFEVDVTDIWTVHAKWPFNQMVPYYRFLAKHPILWRAMYTYGLFPPTKTFTELWSWRSSFPAFENFIRSANPDLVVSVHPLCQLMPITIVKRMNEERKPEEKIPFITVVTDLGGAHCTWFDRRVDACFVPSEAVKHIAERNGVPTNKVILRGLPVRPAFWKPAATTDKSKLRKQLGLATDAGRKTVLLMGGGDGVGGIENIACELGKCLSKRSFNSQIVVICGHNKKMSDSLLKKLPSTDKFKVAIKGFVNNIDQYMAASDCLVTKAGPGTIAESMIRGLPIVLSYFLPGQEYGNIAYVVNGGFGVYTGNRARSVAAAVCSLFSNDTLMHEMSARGKISSHMHATKIIAKEIAVAALEHKIPYIK